MIASLLFIWVLGISSPIPSPQSSHTPESVKSYSAPDANTPVATPHSASVAEQSPENGENKKQNSEASEGLFLKWTKRYEAVINGFSAVVMAVFTVILTIYTVRLWKSGEKHSERELRAYVQVSKSCITRIGADLAPEAVLNIKNYGQTPAYDCRTSLTIAVRDFPGSDFPLAKQLPDTSGIAPGDFYESRIAFQSMLTEKGYTDILIGKKAIYVLCQTRYRDVFNKERVSNFRAYFCGSLEDPSRHHDLLSVLNREPLALIRTQEGNDCT